MRKYIKMFIELTTIFFLWFAILLALVTMFDNAGVAPGLSTFLIVAMTPIIGSISFTVSLLLGTLVCGKDQ